MSSKTSIWNSQGEAEKYASARPDHPPAIVSGAVTFLKQKYLGSMSQAADVGCGTGISTRNLSGLFEKVVGTDLSGSMIDQATKENETNNLSFLVSSAENLPLESQSCQLITVGRAIHYFDQSKFFKEADRVLVPGGVIAYYSVHFPTIIVPGDQVKSKKVDEIFWDYLNNRLKGFWPINQYDGCEIGSRNRRDYYVEKIKCPYDEKCLEESISFDREVSLETLAQELSSYSASVSFRKIQGDEMADQMMDEFRSRVKEVVGNPSGSIELITRNSFFVVMTRKPI